MGLRVITRQETLVREEISKKTGEKADVPPGNTADQAKDDMLSNLAKYVPVPVLAGYTVLDTIFVSVKPAFLVWWITFGGLLIFAILITYFMVKKQDPIPNQNSNSNSNPDQSPNKNPTPDESKNNDLADLQEKLKKIIHNQAKVQAILAAVAFIAYAMALGGPFATLTFWQPYYGTIALVFTSLGIIAVLAWDMK